MKRHRAENASATSTVTRIDGALRPNRASIQAAENPAAGACLDFTSRGQDFAIFQVGEGILSDMGFFAN
jgi:hypothetical protein